MESIDIETATLNEMIDFANEVYLKDTRYSYNLYGADYYDYADDGEDKYDYYVLLCNGDSSRWCPNKKIGSAGEYCKVRDEFGVLLKTGKIELWATKAREGDESLWGY